MNALLAWLFAAVLGSVVITAVNLREIRKVRVIMATNQEKIDQYADQFAKAKDEIVAGIAALEDQIAAGAEPEALDFTRLKALAQELDDLHEDAVDEGDQMPGDGDVGDPDNPDPGFTNPNA